MADVTTDVLIIGTGPAGSAAAALLFTYGVENMVVNRDRWLANTPLPTSPINARWKSCATLVVSSKRRPTC